MIKLITILTLLIEALIGAPTEPAINEDYEALLKLAKYTTFSDNSDKVRIVIATASSESFKDASIYLKNKTLNDKQIEPVALNSETDFEKVSILFIEKDAEIDVENLIENINGKQILTITNDVQNLKLGVMFYIKGDNDELEYMFNRQAVINSGLSIKSTLLSPNHSYDE